MCGISGLVNCGDAETLARMTNVQTHRGPDDCGLWERRFPDGGYIGLGSRRLANLRPMVDDLLSESQVRKRGLFRPEVVRRYVDEQRRGAEDWSMQIWQLLTLEIWTQFFLDGGARSFAQRQIGVQQLTTA